jgi:hypothetical protein
MGTKSRESICGASIRAAAEQAAEARKNADRLACEVWNKRMLGFQGPAQPSPALGDAINAGYFYLEVKCLGCNTHQTVPLNIVRRPKTTPIHELERYMRCKDCSKLQGRPYKRSAIWWRCGRGRFRQTTLRQLGGRASETERNMSGFSSGADIRVDYQDVRFVPQPDFTSRQQVLLLSMGAVQRIRAGGKSLPARSIRRLPTLQCQGHTVISSGSLPGRSARRGAD